VAAFAEALDNSTSATAADMNIRTVRFPFAILKG
jgi:hypothetical protein